jgi:hypothetical protein
MYNKVECVTLTCDNCKEVYESDQSGFSIFSDKNTLNEKAVEDGWQSVTSEHARDAAALVFGF